MHAQRIKYVQYLSRSEMLINVQLCSTPKLIKLQRDCTVWYDNNASIRRK